MSVDITFGIDQEGLVNVAAIDSETGRQRSVAVRANTGLDNEEKEELMSQFAAEEAEEAGLEIAVPAPEQDEIVVQMQNLIVEVEKYYTAFTRIMAASGEDVMESHSALVEVLVTKSKEAVNEQDVEAVRENYEPMEQLLDDLKTEVAEAQA